MFTSPGYSSWGRCHHGTIAPGSVDGNVCRRIVEQIGPGQFPEMVKGTGVNQKISGSRGFAYGIQFYGFLGYVQRGHCLNIWEIYARQTLWTPGGKVR